MRSQAMCHNLTRLTVRALSDLKTTSHTLRASRGNGGEEVAQPSLGYRAWG